jgi:hypothetical protein
MVTNWQCSHSPIKPQRTSSRITWLPTDIVRILPSNHMATNWQCSHSPIKTQHTSSRQAVPTNLSKRTHIFSYHHVLPEVRLILPNVFARSVTHDKDKLQKRSLSNFSHFPFYIHLILKYFHRPAFLNPVSAFPLRKWSITSNIKTRANSLR